MGPIREISYLTDGLENTPDAWRCYLVWRTCVKIRFCKQKPQRAFHWSQSTWPNQTGTASLSPPRNLLKPRLTKTQVSWVKGLVPQRLTFIFSAWDIFFSLLNLKQQQQHQKMWLWREGCWFPPPVTGSLFCSSHRKSGFLRSNRASQSQQQQQRVQHSLLLLSCDAPSCRLDHHYHYWLAVWSWCTLFTTGKTMNTPTQQERKHHRASMQFTASYSQTSSQTGAVWAHLFFLKIC